MKKIKWVNILKVVVAIPCAILVLHDLCAVMFGIIFGPMASWTSFGLATFIMAIIELCILFDEELSF
jgi:hypothetical protein